MVDAGVHYSLFDTDEEGTRVVIPLMDVHTGYQYNIIVEFDRSDCPALTEWTQVN